MAFSVGLRLILLVLHWLFQADSKNVQYDAYAKYILSQKEVLARILKFTIAEFQDSEAEESLCVK